MSPTELALIGTGTWGRNYLSTIAGMEEVSLIAVASRSGRGLASAPPGAHLTREWSDLLSSDAAGVIVATSPGSHREIAEAFIRSGKAVLVEKPFTLSLKDAAALERAATERGVFVMVNHIYLFHPAWKVVKGWPDGRDVLRVRTTGGGRGPFRQDCSPLWDYAPHDLAICMDILGEVVTASATRIASEVVDDEAQLWAIDLTFGDGRSARAVVGNGMAARTRRVEIMTSDETLTFDDTLADVLIHRDAHGSRAIPVEDRTTPLENVVRTFATSLAETSPDGSSLHDAMEIVRILEGLEG